MSIEIMNTLHCALIESSAGMTENALEMLGDLSLSQEQEEKIGSILVKSATSEKEDLQLSKERIFIILKGVPQEMTAFADFLKNELGETTVLSFIELKYYRKLYEEAHHCQLSYSEIFSYCPNLERLVLSRSNVNDVTLAEIIEAARECPNLKHVSLNGCKEITKVSLNGLIRLKSVDLSQMPQLRHLDISDCTGIKSIHLQESPELEFINIHRLSRLKKLNLSHQLRLHYLDASNCTSLKHLNLDGCGELKTLNLQGASGLKYLHLDECRSLTTLLSEGMSELEHLDAAGCSPQLTLPPVRVKGYFYEIRNADGDLLGYLLGTAHVMDRSLMNMNEAIRQAVYDADYLYMECIETAPENPLLVEQSEETLKQALETYQSLLSQFPLKDMTWEQFQKEMSSLDILDALRLCFRQYRYVRAAMNGSIDPSNEEILSIDGWFRHQFEQGKKSVFGLETYKEHLDALGSEYYHFKTQRSIQGILNPNLESNKTIVAEHTQRWREGEIDAVSTKNKKGTLAYNVSEKRSVKFGEVILQDLIKNPQTIGFYAIGASHLYNAKGVIAFLESKDLKVNRI